MSKPIDDGGPAFPHCEPENAMYTYDGISARDWFATHASEADIADMVNVAFRDGISLNRRQARYRHADAMLAERSRDRE